MTNKISTFKFLRPGWWILHAIGIAAVYALGNVLGR